MGKILYRNLCLISWIGMSTAALGQTVTLSLASGAGTPGGSVVLPLTITSTGGAQAAGVQWSFTYSADITSVTVAVGSAATTAQKSLSCNGNLCLVSGMNSTVIADGTVATATFQIAANPSAQTIPIQITSVVAASLAGSSIPAIGVSGMASLPSLPDLSGISCTSVALNTPGSTSCTVSLTAAAPAGGMTIALSSNNVNLSVPSSLTIAAGQTSVSFTATAAAVSASQTAAITATSGATTKSVTLTLASSVQLTGLTCSPSGLNSGGATLCTASLNAAVTSAVTISVSRNNEAVSVPASVVVPAGQSGATFEATAGNVNSSQTATIVASLNGVAQSAVLSLNASGVPTAVSVAPSGGSGIQQVFTFVFSDTQSASNLSTIAILFAPSVAYPNSCFAIYDRTRGTIQLEWDNVTGADAKPVSSGLTVQNSQCMIGATSVTSSGLTNTLTLDVTFKGAFSGAKNIYMYAANANGTVNTGWVQRGTYLVTAGSASVPTADSVSPGANSGTAQTFSFVYSDSQNASNLTGAAMLFAPSGAYPNSCFVVYDRNQGSIQLEWDNVTGADAKAVGSPVNLQNSQCIIGATSVTSSALTTTITLAITFKAAFSGLKNIYMYGADMNGANTGWVQMGTYAVTTVSAPVPSADSVSPSAGSGASQSFSFVFSDSQNAANLSTAAVLFAPSLSYPNSCFVIYDRNRGTIQLEWDNVAGADVKLVGSPILLQNSQCSIGATSIATSGLSNTLTLDITFKAPFAGAKNIYLYGADTDGTINTGWVQKGTWSTF